ncbi:hypothetical protein E8E11_003811 [Didymella keratinophila]|nr:hypothetical protein E8E11_003811 [Didymella keratinophila]
MHPPAHLHISIASEAGKIDGARTCVLERSYVIAIPVATPQEAAFEMRSPSLPETHSTTTGVPWPHNSVKPH